MDVRRRASLILAAVSAAAALALVLLFVFNTNEGAADGATGTTVSLADEGAALFLAKGCARCHQHDGAPPSGLESLHVGPNLTNYANDAAFLRRWLADPQAIRPETEMPNLNLADDEIDRLIAFLNRPK